MPLKQEPSLVGKKKIKRSLRDDAEPSFNYKVQRMTPVEAVIEPKPDHIYAKPPASEPEPILPDIEEVNEAPPIESDIESDQQKYERVMAENAELKKEIDSYRKVFKFKEQQDMICGRIKKVREWSDAAINYSVNLRFYCGTGGYEYLRKLGFVLPGIRTLNRAAKNLIVKPGICTHPFELLKLNVEAMALEKTRKSVQKGNGEIDSSEEVEAVLGIDECSIKQLLEYDTTFQTVSGYISVPRQCDPDVGENETFSSSVVANKAMVYIIRGVKENFKIAVCYDLTAGSFKDTFVKRRIDTIIKMAKEKGVKISSITSDMGSCNENL